MRHETLPETVEEALEHMRFGCPFQHFSISEYDVRYFERRMTRAAEILEAALEKKDVPNKNVIEVLKECAYALQQVIRTGKVGWLQETAHESVKGIIK
jgi:hypothetical protein